MIRDNTDIDPTADDDQEGSELTAAEREMILKLFARIPANTLKRTKKSSPAVALQKSDAPRDMSANHPSSQE